MLGDSEKDNHLLRELLGCHGFLNDSYCQLLGSYREYLLIQKCTPINEIMMASMTIESGPFTNWFRMYCCLKGGFEGGWVKAKDHYVRTNPAQSSRLIQVRDIFHLCT